MQPTASEGTAAATASATGGGAGGGNAKASSGTAAAPAASDKPKAQAAPAPAPPPRKKKPKKRKEKNAEGDGAPARKKKKPGRRAGSSNNSSNWHDQLPGLSAAQLAVNEQMRRALEEDQYSAVGSIVDTASDSEDEGGNTTAASGGPGEPNSRFLYRGAAVRLDRAALCQAVRKHNLLERLGAAGTGSRQKALLRLQEDDDDEEEEDDDAMETDASRGGRGGAAAAAAAPNQKNKKKTRSSSKETSAGGPDKTKTAGPAANVLVAEHHHHDPLAAADGLTGADADDLDRDGGSIFGQTTGSSNSTWVECDKCKKWRRLRGVVDEKKLPSKWYCSMNKNDPERARCSAPEEEYETQHTAESAADARTRKHLRVWVRRLQCNESYEARQPAVQTRGSKKRNAAAAAGQSSKDPYEWVRCCNAACGKWRAVLRTMDAKTAVMERTNGGEWYCVQNCWDEKVASCAAPQENLPSLNCPPWVLQDE